MILICIARRSQDLYLPFFRGGITYGVEELVLPESDDGTEGPITIDPGFPLGSLVQPDFYVSVCLRDVSEFHNQ